MDATDVVQQFESTLRVYSHCMASAIYRLIVSRHMQVNLHDVCQ